MFGRWRKGKEEAGITCPLCGEISPEETEQCPKCYHQLQKGLLEQDDQAEGAVSSSLFNELHADDDDDDEEEVVDWSRHAFDIDDVTIDVSQYEDGSDAVALSHAPNFAAIESDVPRAAKASPDTLETGEYELTTSDAPKNVEKFVVPTQKVVEEKFEEPAHQVNLVVPILPKGGESSDEEDAELADPSEVPDDESESLPTSAQPAATAEPVTTPSSAASTSGAAPTTSAEMPALPTHPQADNNGAVAPSLPRPPAVSAQSSASAPSIPNLPATPSSATAPAGATAAAPNLPAAGMPNLPTPPAARPTAGAFSSDIDIDVSAAPAPATATPPTSEDRIWPWPQRDAWDDLTVRRELRQVMEAIKDGNLDEATRGMDKLGPHLGERSDILFHVGVVLKKLGRDQALRNMLENARRLHPEDQHVATALTSLGM